VTQDHHRAPDPEALLSLALRACDAADDVLMQGHLARRSTDLKMWSKSSATDLATEKDVAAERVILNTLLGARPGDVVLGEESGLSGATSAPTGQAGAVRWVVDPLDGTINYVYGLPHWAVSIAAEIDGEVVAGVVSIPVMGERFTAMRGQGAWWHPAGASAQRLVMATPPPQPAQALVATGFGYAQKRRREQAAVVAELLPAVRDIRRLGAAAIDLCHLACGRVDAYYERGLQPWDLAAGGLIAREAGARVEGWNGSPAGEGLVIAAAPGLFEQVHALLAAAAVDTTGGSLARLPTVP